MQLTPENPHGLRTWIDIDLDAVKKNFFTACSLTEAKITCVLKANAYGHGDVVIAHTLQACGCTSFAVSCAREALRLRSHGIQGDILVMGVSEKDYLPALIEENITLCVADRESMRDCDRAASRIGRMAHVHLKIDTGFHRLGFPCMDTTISEIRAIHNQCKHVAMDGLFSHLGLINQELDEKQNERFLWIASNLEAVGIPIREKHLCDSIGLVRYPQWHYDRCRVGAFLFGVRPSRSEHMPFEDLETLRFCTTVVQVRDVPAGEPVGYGDEDIPSKPMRIATLCAGYGDGYPRHLSNGKGQVLIHGKRARTVGLICMDQMMIDVTDIPDCKPGDVAYLIGNGLSYMEFADMAETNRNECLTILSNRPVRVYHEEGCEDRIVDTLLGENT